MKIIVRGCTIEQIFAVHSINLPSMPSPVYQWRKALRRNMTVNCSATRFQVSWTAVVLPTKVVAILRPLGGMSQMDTFTLFGIHSTKYDEFLFTTFNICSSTSLEDIVVQCLVVKSETLVGILDELMYRKRGIVWLDDCIRNLGRRDHRVGRHDTVGVLLSDFGDKKSSHTSTSSSSHGMRKLETLHTITALGLFSYDIKDRVNEFGTFSVVTLGPVISSTYKKKRSIKMIRLARQEKTILQSKSQYRSLTSLPKHKVVRPE